MVEAGKDAAAQPLTLPPARGLYSLYVYYDGPANGRRIAYYGPLSDAAHMAESLARQLNGSASVLDEKGRLLHTTHNRLAWWVGEAGQSWETWPGGYLRLGVDRRWDSLEERAWYEISLGGWPVPGGGYPTPEEAMHHAEGQAIVLAQSILSALTNYR